MAGVLKSPPPEAVREASADWLLSDETASTSSDEKAPIISKWPHPSQRRKCSTFFLAFTGVLTVFLLAGLTLNLQLSSRSHHVDPPPLDEPQTSGAVATPKTIKYQEHIPESPHLRDAEEYILSPSWKVDDPPVTREYFWTINDAIFNPDGVYRPMILINNQYPGPLVECNEGDTILVHVQNKAVNATAIHFHGMFQNGTNHMDGTVGVTQCPIAPNSTFTLRFQVNHQHGTYWYHAHHSAQASDGLLGPMVVHSKKERDQQLMDYSSDRVIMIQDHYHNLTSELLMDYLAPDQENNEPVPDNALMNGRNVRDCADFEGWQCDNTGLAIPTIDLEAGQRHRLRIINVGAFAEFQMQLDEHPFYVTEVDGTDVHPEPIHRLNILPAQRYSIVVETNVTSASAFWMRARMVTHCFKNDNERLEAELRAVVRYTEKGVSKQSEQPTSREWPDAIEVICRDLNTTSLRPVETISAPPADEVVTLRANFEIGDWRLARGFFNDSTWHPNATYPSLHHFIDDGSQTTSLQKPIGINEITFDRHRDLVLESTGVRVVDISINNFDDGAHPFHMHGHKFFVMLQGRDGYPPSAEELPEYLESRGLLENPLRRDTVTVEGYAWAVIRVVLDNPGLWAFHCHNTWHAESGMVMQMLVRPEVVADWKVETEHRDMCKQEGVTTGMRPDDSYWFGQFRT